MAVGRSRELWDRPSRDHGEGQFILRDDSVMFLTERERYWALAFEEIESFRVRRGALGRFSRLRSLELRQKGGRTFHVTIDISGAENAAHILSAKSVAQSDRKEGHHVDEH